MEDVKRSAREAEEAEGKRKDFMKAFMSFAKSGPGEGQQQQQQQQRRQDIGEQRERGVCESAVALSCPITPCDGGGGAVFASWNALHLHVSSPAHGRSSVPVPPEECLSRCSYHLCRICDSNLPGDVELVARHAFRDHGISILKYLNQVRFPISFAESNITSVV